MKKNKLAILVSHPIQYFAPLFAALSKSDELQIIVYYCSDISIKGGDDEQFGQKIKWDIPLLEGYNYCFLKNHSLNPRLATHFWGLVNLGIFTRLLKDRPNVLVIHGWVYFSYLLGFLAANFLGIKVCFRIENPLNQELMKTGLKQKIKNVLLKYFLFKRANKFLYIGHENRKYYEHMGIPEDRMFFTPYCVDNARFRRSYLELVEDRNKIRRDFGINDQAVVFLYSGKLISKKRPLDLLKAFIRLQKEDAFLIFLGEGGLRNILEKEIRTNNIVNIFITGFKNQTELAPYYVASDVFVLPSGAGETWGLVVNEAMNFSMPVIVSNLAGCNTDLVKEGRNGFTFPAGDVQALSDKMNYFLINREKIPKMGKHSAQLVREYYSYEKVVNGIIDAIKNN